MTCFYAASLACCLFCSSMTTPCRPSTSDQQAKKKVGQPSSVQSMHHVRGQCTTLHATQQRTCTCLLYGILISTACTRTQQSVHARSAPHPAHLPHCHACWCSAAHSQRCCRYHDADRQQQHKPARQAHASHPCKQATGTSLRLCFHAATPRKSHKQHSMSHSSNVYRSNKCRM